MKRFFVVMVAILMMSGVASAFDVGGADVEVNARLGYPITTDVENGLTVHVEPDYMANLDIEADFENSEVYFVAGVVEDTSLTYQLGTEYYLHKNIAVFLETTKFDMKNNREDFAFSWGGVNLRFK